MIFLSADYLEACALVRKGRAKETCDDAHDRLCYITLQRGVRMFPVTGVVAYLGNDRKCVMYNAHRITLPPRVRQVRHRMPYSPSQIMQCKEEPHFPSSLFLRCCRWLTLQMSTRKFSNNFHMWLEV